MTGAVSTVDFENEALLPRGDQCFIDAGGYVIGNKGPAAKRPSQRQQQLSLSVRVSVL